MRALILRDSFCEKICKDSKLKLNRDVKIEVDEEILLISKDYAYAKIVLVKKSGIDSIFEYSFKIIEIFESKRDIKIAHNTNEFDVIKQVTFKNTSLQNLKKAVSISKIDKNRLPATMTNEALFYDHAILHYRFAKAKEGLKYENWTLEDFINYHSLIVNELKKRELEHFKYNDDLDEKSKKIQKQYMNINPTGQKKGERIFIDEILDSLDSFKIRHPYICLVGGIVIHGSTENDIDILIKDSENIRDEFKHILEWRILRALPPHLWDRVQFHYDKFFGPFTDHVELFDLTIDRINKNNKIINMSLIKQAQDSEDVKRQAEISLKEDKIKLFRFFTPLKSALSPFQAYRLAEMYNIDEVVNHLKKIARKESLDTEIPQVFVQKKYDGARHIIHKDKDKIKIYSDEGIDNVNKFPAAVKELRRLKADNFVIDCEIELWKNGSHQPREKISGYLHEKDSINDEGIILNCFDLLYLNDTDLHKEKQLDRYDKLKELDFKQSTIDKPDLDIKLNLVKTDIIDTENELRKSIKKYSDSIASEGSMIKLSDSIYPLDGITTKVIKYKKYIEVHVIVFEVNKTKVPTVFNYSAALGVSAGQKVNKDTIIEIDNKKYSFCGKTFNTDIKAEQGDILTVSFHTMNYYKNHDTGEFRVILYEPRVIEKRSQSEKPDFISDAIRIGKESGLLEEKTEKNLIDEVIELNRQVEEDFRKSIDPYMILPPESEKYKFVTQHHWRGKSVHADLRIESLNKETLIGWTLNNQIKGAVQENVESLEDAKKYMSSKYSKIDWNSGEWAERIKTGTTKSVNVELVSERKQLEPPEWLSVEGVIPAGGIGATKNNPGVFHIVDKGVCEYLAQKPWMHEYYFQSERGKGGLKGRYFFRQLETRQIGKLIDSDDEIIKIVVPAAETEFKDETAWFFIKPDDQTPYVLSNRAIKDDWIPPFQISSLPKYLKKQVPSDFQYWTRESEKDRIDIRNELVTQMKDLNVQIEKFMKLSQTDARFVLQYQTFRTKGEKPVRAGATRDKYDLRIDFGKNFLLHWIMEVDPIENEVLSGIYRRDANKAFMNIQGEIPSGTALNPSRQTQSFIKIVDQGKCILLINDVTFKKVQFAGLKLRGTWTITQKSRDGNWLIERSKGTPQTEQKKVLTF